MKKICSILLSAAIIITAIFCPASGILAAVATAETTSSDVITNTFDESGYTYTDIKFDKSKNPIATIVDGGVTGKALKFNRIYNTSYCATLPYVNIYNDSSATFDSFKPKKDTSYKLSFKYKQTSKFNYASNTLKLFGVKNADLSDGTDLGDLCVIEKKTTVPDWTEAELSFTVNDDFNSLGILLYSTVGNTSAQPCNIYIDDIELIEITDIDNTYEETDLGTFSGGSGTHKLNGTNLYLLGINSLDNENTTRVVQFNNIAGQTNINAGTFTYVDIYNPYDVDFASFKPEADSYYKITFDFRTRAGSTANSYQYFNIRGRNGSEFSDNLATAATVIPGDTDFPYSYAWGKASAIIQTDDTAYDALVISLETPQNSDITKAIYPSLDNIHVEKVELPSYENTYEEKLLGTIASGSGTHKLNGTNLHFLGINSGDTENTTRVLQFSAVTGQNEIKKGNITHIELYNPYDKEFTTASPVPGIKPINNSVYKITFDFKIRSSSYGNIYFNIRGKKGGVLGEILGNAAVIEKGDKAYSNSTWGTAEAYIYTGDNDALAITAETDTNSDAALFPYLDNITVTPVKEYGSGVISEIAPAENNKNGLLAIKNGKLFEMEENDYAKVNFTVDTDSAIAGSSIVARTVDDSGNVSDVITLFDFSEHSGKKTYNTTFNADKSGKVVISVYKNDSTVVNQNATIADLEIDAYTPSDLQGDVNLDGEINIADLVSLYKKQSSNYVLSGDYLSNADLNNSGAVDEGDLTLSRKQLLGISVNS